MKLKIYNFVFEIYEDEKDYYIDCDMNVINKDDNSVNPQCEVQFDQGWISVEESLPFGLSLVSGCDDMLDYFDVAYWCADGSCWIGNQCQRIDGVTHWMPLPNPPKF